MDETPNTIQRPQTSIGVIFFTVFLDLVGFSIIFPLFPKMLDFYLNREASNSVLGGLVQSLESFAHVSGGTGDVSIYVTVLFGGVLGALYALLQFLVAPIWGRLSDERGRRKILLITVAGLTLSYLLWAFSASFAVLVFARVLGGIMGGNISVASAAIADITDEKNRARGMGALGAAFGLGFIMGPAIGAGLYHLYPHDIGLAGTHPFTLAALGAFFLGLINLVWLSKRFHETLLPSSTRSAHHLVRTINPVGALLRLELPDVRRINLIYLLFSLAFTGMEFTLTFLVKERFSYGPKETAGLFVFIGVIIALVQGGIVRRMAPKFGERKMGLFGLMDVALGLVLIAISTGQGLFYLGVGIMAVGSALVNPSLSSLASLMAPPDRQGEILGLFRSMGSLARAIGPIAACMIYWRLGSSSPYWVAALMMLPPLLLMLKMGQEHLE